MPDTKYVIYKRLSKEDRSRVQHGFESQSLDIQHFLDTNGGEVIASFKEFISGGADDKVELSKAMEVCKSTGATLLVSKLCRLSRRVSQIATYMEGEISFKVAVMPSANNFMLHLYSALNEEERTNIRSRVKRGLEAAKNKGVALGGASQKWKKSFQANKANHKRPAFIASSREKQLPAVDYIRNALDLTKGSLTQEQLANHLNSKNFSTATGKPFTKVTVGRLIKTHNIEYSRKSKHDNLSCK